MTISTLLAAIRIGDWWISLPKDRRIEAVLYRAQKNQLYNSSKRKDRMNISVQLFLLSRSSIDKISIWSTCSQVNISHSILKTGRNHWNWNHFCPSTVCKISFHLFIFFIKTIFFLQILKEIHILLVFGWIKQINYK